MTTDENPFSKLFKKIELKHSKANTKSLQFLIETVNFEISVVYSYFKNWIGEYHKWDEIECLDFCIGCSKIVIENPQFFKFGELSYDEFNPYLNSNFKSDRFVNDWIICFEGLLLSIKAFTLFKKKKVVTSFLFLAAAHRRQGTLNFIGRTDLSPEIPIYKNIQSYLARKYAANGAKKTNQLRDAAYAIARSRRWKSRAAAVRYVIQELNTKEEDPSLNEGKLVRWLKAIDHEGHWPPPKKEKQKKALLALVPNGLQTNWLNAKIDSE
ncbi:hypothetical protein [uncultured Pseudacidovorax sp.]|uniref:hypothetical protein n=1 Tax=uncultured Pseudacidovorax sp. TaxID=679313 RepID=UPI0025EAA0BE|nr:hypothetical protein [uncultured Pseudacidovorax sp.]